jgi:hypothetical protein
MTQLTRELETVALRAHQQAGAPGAARGAATSAQAKADSDAAQLAKLQILVPDLQKAAEAAKAAVEHSGQTVETIRAWVSHDPEGTKVWAKQLEALDLAEHNLDMIMGHIQGLQGRLPGEKSTAAQADRDASRIQAMHDEDIKTREELIRQIQNLTTKYGISDSAGATTGAMDIFKNILGQPTGGGFSGSDIVNAAALEAQRQRFNQHEAGIKPLTDAQNRFLDTFEKYAPEAANIWSRTHQLLLVIAGAQTDYGRKLAALEEIVKNLRNQRNSGMGSVPPPS